MRDAPQWPLQNRPDVAGLQGAVSSDHPLATAAGFEVLRRGGNAVDAAVTMAGVLAVVRPHMNGIGGDAFGILFDGRTGEVSVLMGSGRAGAEATPQFFTGRGVTRVPGSGAGSVTVPGAVAAWTDALARHGTITLAEALEPAIRYAEHGFPVSTRLHDDIAAAGRGLDPAGRELYLPGGRPPPVGTLLRNPALAATLRAIAEGGPDAFYKGAVGERLAEFIEAEGGYLRAGDFAAHRSTWVEPLRAPYLGHEVLVLPPSNQGLAQLQQMLMASSFDLKAMGHNGARYLHTLVEIKKLVFADRDRWIGDPEFADVPVDRLLEPEYLRGRAALVRPDAAMDPPPPGLDPGRTASEGGEAGTGADDGQAGDDEAEPRDDGDTVYLTAVDRWGNAVSWIQSLFSSFGSRLVEPSTGIVLHNRGAGFNLDPAHPSVIAPGKRPFHTLTPLMALRDGRLAFTLGSPGGDGQTQTLIQVFNNLVLFGMTPQQAVEAPRYRSNDGRNVSIEAWLPAAVQAELAALGHELRPVAVWSAVFGGAQMIYVHPESGALVAAADPRREAYALAY